MLLKTCSYRIEAFFRELKITYTVRLTKSIPGAHLRTSWTRGRPPSSAPRRIIDFLLRGEGVRLPTGPRVCCRCWAAGFLTHTAIQIQIQTAWHWEAYSSPLSNDALPSLPYKQRDLRVKEIPPVNKDQRFASLWDDGRGGNAFFSCWPWPWTLPQGSLFRGLCDTWSPFWARLHSRQWPQNNSLQDTTLPGELIF